MKRFIVSGAGGFIGKELTKKLLQNGNEVVAVVRDAKKLSELASNENLNIVECEMENYHALALMIDKRCDGFIHFAWAGASGSDRMDCRLQQSNIKNSFSAICAARELGCECFIGAGSQAEYGVCEGEISESYREEPITEYGRAKLAVKRIGLEYGKTVGMRFVYPRIFSAYGVGNSETTMIMSVLRQMLNNRPAELSVCTQMWDYTHVSDVADAYLCLLDKADSGVYNISYGEYRPLKEFVLEMKRISNSSSELKFGSVQQGATGLGFMPNVDKLKALGWRPRVTFSQGIYEIITENRTKWLSQ